MAGDFQGPPEVCAYLGCYRGPIPYLRSIFYLTGQEELPPRVLVVIHGFGCNVEGYHETLRNTLKQKEPKGNVVILSPLFSKAMFPTNEDFQCGNVYRRNEGGYINDETRWTFAVIPQMVKEACPEASTYIMYGHSAGGQFTHRFCYFDGLLRSKHPDFPAIERALIANPGWYTMPDLGISFPYGLKNIPLADEKEFLKEFVRLPKRLLLGTADTDTEDKDLRKTAEANAQGPHRLARGELYFKKHQELQDALELPAEAAGLDVVFVEGAGHSNAKMCSVALDNREIGTIDIKVKLAKNKVALGDISLAKEGNIGQRPSEGSESIPEACH
eukprot:Skav220077  [mRNA]  locus=scaffold262:197152:199120:+ [translate_table: standard]